MPSELILYDLPSKDRCACWSLNPWKTRLALNYKGIPYKTEWIEYPDLASRFKELGIEPNQEGMAYTSPAVTLPSGEHVMDSIKIAPELEKLQPSPSLHLDSPDTDAAQEAVKKVMGGLFAVLMPRIPRDLLTPPSAEYFSRTRKERFGMSLDELEVSDKAKAAWENAAPGFDDLRRLLNQSSSSPFVREDGPSYADFIIVGMFQIIKRLGNDVFDETMAVDLAFPRLYLACEQWLKRDDH